MKKNILITFSFIMFLFLMHKRENVKITTIKDKIYLCDSYEYCQKFNEINTKISIDSFFFDKDYTNFFTVLITNNSDSLIIIETLKSKYDTIYYLPFLYERFYIDSFKCHQQRKFTYHEILAPKHKFNYVKPKDKLYLRGNNWIDEQKKENLCFLYLGYYPSLSFYKINKISYTGTYFEFKNNSMLKLK